MKNKEKILLRCAELGDPEAMYRLASIYIRSKRYNESLQWLFNAVNVKYAKVFGPLGVFYFNGALVEKNLDKAISLWTEGVDLGDPESMYYLAYQYEYGEGVEQDIDKAFELHTRSADLGNANSTYALYYNYKWGGIVEKNAKLAEEWHCKLLKQEEKDREKESETRFPSLYDFPKFCPTLVAETRIYGENNDN